MSTTADYPGGSCRQFGIALAPREDLVGTVSRCWEILAGDGTGVVDA